MDVKELIERARMYLEGTAEDCFNDSVGVGNTAYNVAKADAYLDFALKELEEKAVGSSYD